MALLSEHDVLHKKFQTAKFRQEGYNQDEVDDFLDEVVLTIRALTEENARLKNELEEANNELARVKEEAAQLQASQGQAHSESHDDGAVAASAPEVAPEPEPQAQPAPEAQTQAFTGGAGAASTDGAAGMLALAQRVHDEYVANGKEEGERIVAEARSESERIIREAEDQHNRTLTKLEEERSLLERKIDELRTFESDYRGRLKEYLESLLQNVSANSQGNI